MFVRFAIAALIVGIVFHKDLKKNMKKEHIKGGLLIGTFLFLAFYVQTVALQYTTPSNNAFITAANVVIVPFLWWACLLYTSIGHLVHPSSGAAGNGQGRASAHSFQP